MYNMSIDYFQASQSFRAVIEGYHVHHGASYGSPMGYAKTAENAMKNAIAASEKGYLHPTRHCAQGCPKWEWF